MGGVNVASLFSECPIVRLNEVYQSRFLNTVSETFSTEDQQLFIASFYCFLNHHPTDDYVVDMDGIWQWLGYSNKQNAKRKLRLAFTESRDYILPIFKDDQAGKSVGQHGGHNREVIRMNVETFKAFCMMAGTAKGAQVRSYYIQLERTLQTLLHEQTAELEQQLQKEIADKQELQQRLDQRGRRYASAVKRETVYIFQDGPNLHKIGRTRDLKVREAAASTFNIEGRMCHAVACVNSKVLEETVHHMLDARRVAKKQDWFTVDFELARATVVAAQLFLDAFMEAPEQLVEVEAAVMRTVEQLQPPELSIPELSKSEERNPEERKPKARKRKYADDAGLPLHIHRYRDASGYSREGFIAHVPGHVAKSFYGKAYTLEEKLAQAVAHVHRLTTGEATDDIPKKSDQEGRRKRIHAEPLPKYLCKIDTEKQQGYYVRVHDGDSDKAKTKYFLSRKLSMGERLEAAMEYLQTVLAVTGQTV